MSYSWRPPRACASGNASSEILGRVFLKSTSNCLQHRHFRDSPVPNSMHIYAGSGVNHLWKVIKKAHVLSKDLRGILRTTGALNIPLLWSKIPGLDGEQAPLFALLHSLNKTNAGNLLHHNLQPTAAAASWKLKDSTRHAYHRI